MRIGVHDLVASNLVVDCTLHLQVQPIESTWTRCPNSSGAKEEVGGGKREKIN